MAADYAKLKVEYVTGSMSLRELADQHGIKAAGLMARAVKDRWDEERKQVQAKISSEAIKKSIPDRVAQLSDFNEKDLQMAKAIRAKASQMLMSCNSPSELRQVAAASEAAQKIARLALGANTEGIAHELPEVVVKYID
jgi:hypothetical protein